MTNAPIEAKVKAGAGIAGLTGLIVWALVAFVPAFHDGVPEPVVAVIPVILSVIGGALAAYQAKHTSRPDLHNMAVPHVTPSRGPAANGPP